MQSEGCIVEIWLVDFDPLLDCYQYKMMAFEKSFVPWHRMEALNNICNKHLAFAEMLHELHEIHLNVFKDIVFISLDDLAHVLQQYTCLRRNIMDMMDTLDVLEENARKLLYWS